MRRGAEPFQRTMPKTRAPTTILRGPATASPSSVHLDWRRPPANDAEHSKKKAFLEILSHIEQCFVYSGNELPPVFLYRDRAQRTVQEVS